MTRGDQPGRAEGLIERNGVQELHPCDQVRGYVEYCRRFHSAIAEHSANVAGCVLFTGDYVTAPYTRDPNQQLASEYPIFTMAANDISERLPAFLNEKISDPAPEFAHAFELGRYRQDRGFMAQIGKQILDPTKSVFELLDDQRRAFALCRATALEAVESLNKGSSNRAVVIVKGPPGSGKSAVAARLWASLVTDPLVPEAQLCSRLRRPAKAAIGRTSSQTWLAPGWDAALLGEPTPTFRSVHIVWGGYVPFTGLT